jgi:hypothetical protein
LLEPKKDKLYENFSQLIENLLEVVDKIFEKHIDTFYKTIIYVISTQYNIYFHMTKYTLLGDRKSLSPRQSMETLMSYAKEQDRLLFNRSLLMSRSFALLAFLTIGPMVFYTSYVYI